MLANAATGCLQGEPVGVVAAASAGGFAACVSRAALAFRFLLRNAIMWRESARSVAGGADAKRGDAVETRRDREMARHARRWSTAARSGPTGRRARETDRERGVAVRNADFGFDEGGTRLVPAETQARFRYVHVCARARRDDETTTTTPSASALAARSVP